MRWARPLARNRSTIAGGWSWSSPTTRPRANAASSGARTPAPRSIKRPHAVRRLGQPAAGTGITEPVGVELADDVLPGDPTCPVLVEGDEATGHRDTVAATPSGNPMAGGTTPAPRARSVAHRRRARPAGHCCSAAVRRPPPPSPSKCPRRSGVRDRHAASARTIVTAANATSTTPNAGRRVTAATRGRTDDDCRMPTRRGGRDDRRAPTTTHAVPRCFVGPSLGCRRRGTLSP